MSDLIGVKTDAKSELKAVRTPVDLTETKEYIGRMGTCYTRTRFVPIRDKVLVKAIWEESPLIVKQEETIKKTNPKFIQVVGLGDEVRGIELFDEVKVGFNAVIEPIDFEENDQSINRKMKTLKDLVISKHANSIKLVEYYCVPYSAIVGIMKSNLI